VEGTKLNLFNNGNQIIFRRKILGSAEMVLINGRVNLADGRKIDQRCPGVIKRKKNKLVIIVDKCSDLYIF
jgi:hypothetical protein